MGNRRTRPRNVENDETLWEYASTAMSKNSYEEAKQWFLRIVETGGRHTCLAYYYLAFMYLGGKFESDSISLKEGIILKPYGKFHNKESAEENDGKKSIKENDGKKPTFITMTSLLRALDYLAKACVTKPCTCSIMDDIAVTRRICGELRSIFQNYEDILWALWNRNIDKEGIDDGKEMKGDGKERKIIEYIDHRWTIEDAYHKHDFSLEIPNSRKMCNDCGRTVYMGYVCKGGCFLCGNCFKDYADEVDLWAMFKYLWLNVKNGKESKHEKNGSRSSDSRFTRDGLKKLVTGDLGEYEVDSFEKARQEYIVLIVQELVGASSLPSEDYKPDEFLHKPVFTVRLTDNLGRPITRGVFEIY